VDARRRDAGPSKACVGDVRLHCREVWHAGVFVRASALALHSSFLIMSLVAKLPMTLHSADDQGVLWPLVTSRWSVPDLSSCACRR
jgi:hypothetical protein